MLRIAPRAPALGSTVGLLGLTLFGCVQRPALVIETSTGEVVPLATWTATLSGALQGTATLSPGVTHREALGAITVRGATPRTAHAWSVQLGECGRDLGILVGPQAYAPLTADEQGTASLTVTLPFTVPTSGRYFVSVHQSELMSSPVVACGNLTKDRPGRDPTLAEARAP